MSRTRVGLPLLGFLLFVSKVQASDAQRIDVFTSSERPLVRAGREQLETATVTTYAVDGLDRFESGLSEGLPADPEIAKTEALRRIQYLNDARVSPAKNAAVGLAKAIRYGVDRYPAVVIDERAVVYGVTDLAEALDRYEAWQREQAR